VRTAGEPLLLVVSPAARALDGESVRVARDVLTAGASVKVVFPESAAELDRVLAHRGRRRPVVIGDDRALHQVVRALHRQRGLHHDAIGVVPVGRPEMLGVARAIGVPVRAVEAARAVLGGAPRALDLLLDESGGVVLGGAGIPGQGGAWRVAPQRTAPATPPNGTGDRAPAPAAVGPPAAGPEARSLRANSRLFTERDGWDPPAVLSALARTVARTLPLPGPPCPRLRVEADGTVLTDLDRPLRHVSIWNTPAGPQRDAAPDDGYAEVVIRGEGALSARAREITVTGADFSYSVDGSQVGPVRARTWTVVPKSWHVTLPA
jgi:hypothetical protein